MLLITLRARKTDPITSETISEYLVSYIQKAKAIKKKVARDITFKNPYATGTPPYMSGHDGFLKHEAENIQLKLKGRIMDNDNFENAYKECVTIFIDKSGVQQAINSWTSAKKLWENSNK